MSPVRETKEIRWHQSQTTKAEKTGLTKSHTLQVTVTKMKRGTQDMQSNWWTHEWTSSLEVAPASKLIKTGISSEEWIQNFQKMLVINREQETAHLTPANGLGNALPIQFQTMQYITNNTRIQQCHPLMAVHNHYLHAMQLNDTAIMTNDSSRNSLDLEFVVLLAFIHWILQGF